MPAHRYTDLVRMFDDIAQYVRRHRVEVFWDDDIASSTYRITTGMNTWAIRASDVANGGDSGKALTLRQALKTHGGKTALLKILNDMRFSPELPPLTAWERILGDDDLPS